MGYEFTPPKQLKYNNIHSIIQNAKDAYCWIFHKESLRWWTPDEFYDEFYQKDFMSIQMINFIEGISIRDPRSGITAAFSQLTKLEEKHKAEEKNLIDRIEVFNKKVIEYYQEKSKPIFRKQP